MQVSLVRVPRGHRRCPPSATRSTSTSASPTSRPTPSSASTEPAADPPRFAVPAQDVRQRPRPAVSRTAGRPWRGGGPRRRPSGSTPTMSGSSSGGCSTTVPHDRPPRVPAAYPDVDVAASPARPGSSRDRRRARRRTTPSRSRAEPPRRPGVLDRPRALRPARRAHLDQRARRATWRRLARSATAGLDLDMKLAGRGSARRSTSPHLVFVCGRSRSVRRRRATRTAPRPS